MRYKIVTEFFKSIFTCVTNYTALHGGINIDTMLSQPRFFCIADLWTRASIGKHRYKDLYTFFVGRQRCFDHCQV